MSHATVVVKLTAKRLAAQRVHKRGRAAMSAIDAALAEIMAPYNEQTEDPRYLVFQDVEPEHRPQYENEGTTKVRTPEGDLLWCSDERFRKPGSLGIGSGTHEVPADCQEVEVPFKELYATFDEFMTDYGGYTLNKSAGKYGYYKNPNAKWDWYSIGGRWRGFFPVTSPALMFVGEAGAGDNRPKEGGSDIVHPRDIDMDAVATQTRVAAETFWSEWQSWLAGTYVERSPFSGPRHTALTIGLLNVVQGPALSDHLQKAIPWADKVRDGDSRASWHDVAKLMERDAFMEQYIDCFCPIKSYAALDNDGWHAPGDMGWFGCSSDNPDSYVKFAREFVGRFIKNAAPDDLLVCVDYHI